MADVPVRTRTGIDTPVTFHAIAADTPRGSFLADKPQRRSRDRQTAQGLSHRDRVPCAGAIACGG